MTEWLTCWVAMHKNAGSRLAVSEVETNSKRLAVMFIMAALFNRGAIIFFAL